MSEHTEASTSVFPSSSDEPGNARKELGERLRYIREKVAKLSRDEMAARIEVSRTTIQAWEAGEREPGGTQLARYAGLWRVSADWLLFGLGSMVSQHDVASAMPVASPRRNVQEEGCIHDAQGSPVDLSEFVFIPRYNVKAAAGHGAISDDESPTFTMAFRRYWIEHYLQTKPSDLSVISVKGDSMAGVLNDRDVILVDHSRTDSLNGLWVLRIDGGLVVKRVQRLPGGILKVSSANEAYEPFTVDLGAENADFAVIGKVVWFGRQVP